MSTSQSLKCLLPYRLSVCLSYVFFQVHLITPALLPTLFQVGLHVYTQLPHKWQYGLVTPSFQYVL